MSSEPRGAGEEEGGAPRHRPESCCRLCLSKDRALSLIGDDSWAYYVIVTCEQMCEQALVCWECRAGLRRMLRLKQQALRARHLLEQAQKTSLDLCLSRLSRATKTDYDATFLNADRRNREEFDTVLGDDLAGLQVNVAADIVPKIEEEYEVDDVWAEQTADLVPMTYQAASVTNIVKTKKEKRRVSAKREAKRVKKEPEVPKQENGSEDAFAVERETAAQYATRRDARNLSDKMVRAAYKCMPCAQLFRSERGLNKHQKQSHCESPDSVMCEICSCRLPDPESLASHAHTHDLYVCTRCPFTTTSPVKIKRHHDTHERMQQREASHSCDVCGKHFKNKQTFTVHYKLHTRSQPYECDHCGKIYNTRIQIFRHLKSHRKHLLCDLCGKSFSNKTYLNLHSLAHADPSERRFECSECHNRFIDKFKLIVHMRSHTGEKPFKCDVCNRDFREKAQLVGHRKKHHQLFDCKVDSKAKQSLERTKSAHRNRPHTESKENTHISSSEDKINTDKTEKTCYNKIGKQLICNFCGKGFKERYRLKFHLAVHSDERPHKCDVCHMTFKYQSGLWTHKLLHKGEKHQCTVCGSLFTQKGNLTAHLKIHTDEKPFECNVCWNKFWTRYNLRNHLKIHLNAAGT